MSSVRYDSGKVSPEPLAQPLQFQPSGRTAKNRFMKGPMAEIMASWDPVTTAERGMPTDNHVELYRRWGEGANSWGVIVTGNIAISQDILTGPGDMTISTQCIPEGEKFQKFKDIAAAATANGSLILGQINHAGRQIDARMNPTTVSASDVQLSESMGMKFSTPHAATKDEIAEIVEGFAHAAEYLEKAGFDGIELHAAHGYLISQFLSRTTNLRTDEYGVQTTANRLRFISDIVAAVKSRVSPRFVVSAKLNSVEFQEGGVTADEANEVCRALEAMGMDFVELSGGTYEALGLTWEKESTRKREAYFIEFAEAIAGAMGPARKMKLYIAGGLRTVPVMVNALKIMDGVSMSRPAAAEPDLPELVLSGKVDGALKSVEGFENDIMKEMLMANTQIEQIGRKQRPLDKSDPKAMEIYAQDLGAWFQTKMAEGDKLTVKGAIQYTGPVEAYV